MGDSITYSEMTFSSKHNSRIPSGSVQNEEMVTYAAVKNKPEGKKKAKSKLNKQVSLQPDASAPTYAVVNKPKKEKNKKPAKTEKVSPQKEDKSLLYTAINKPNISAQEDNTTTTETQQEHPRAYEDPKMLQRSTENGHVRRRTLLFGRVPDSRHLKLLAGVLIVICLILLITIISLGVTCSNNPISSSGPSRSGTSGSNDSSGRSSSCPDLWITINDKCYFLSENKKPRSLSDKDCTERDSRLAVVKEETIRRLVTITGKEFWVGLIRHENHGGVWTQKWADGSMETITEGTGSCAKLGSHLILDNCYTELNYICERNTV